MSFGPNPWQQLHWDARAAGNFVCGGSGSGLIVFGALWALLGVPDGASPAWPLLAGVALVGVGLTCVWAEIGRPLRALNVFRNPNTSWMSREAMTAALLVPCTLAAAAGVFALALPAALLALVFIYCQGRMLVASRGIPAWREPLTLPLIIATALAEGGALFWLLPLATVAAQPVLWWLFGAALLARMLSWRAWRAQLTGAAAPRALAAIDQAGRVLLVAGTVLPLGIVLLVGLGLASLPGLAAAAGLLALAGGAWFKYTLITRAAFNQGFALAHLPVRGTRR